MLSISNYICMYVYFATKYGFHTNSTVFVGLYTFSLNNLERKFPSTPLRVVSDLVSLQGSVVAGRDHMSVIFSLFLREW